MWRDHGVRLAVVAWLASTVLLAACAPSSIEARAVDRSTPSAAAAPIVGPTEVALVPTAVPTTVAAGQADEVSAALADDGSPGEHNPADPDPDVAAAAPANEATGDADPVDGSDAAIPRPVGVVAASVGDAIRAWDLTNRLIFEADPAAFERVAAEIEQFVTTSAAGRRIAYARLADDAYLAATLDDAGRVTGVVTLSGTADARDAAVGFTSLAFAIDDPGTLRGLAGEYTEVVDGGPGEREIFDFEDSAVVVVKRDRTPGRVALVHVMGATAAELEPRADALIAAVELAIAG